MLTQDTRREMSSSLWDIMTIVRLRLIESSPSAHRPTAEELRITNYELRVTKEVIGGIVTCILQREFRFRVSDPVTKAVADPWFGHDVSWPLRELLMGGWAWKKHPMLPAKGSAASTRRAPAIRGKWFKCEPVQRKAANQCNAKFLSVQPKTEGDTFVT